MTTNSMGLEQTLSDGELTVITDTDHVQCGDAAAMARELLAYRKAYKPVMFIDGDISPNDAEKLAAAIREFNSEPSDSVCMAESFPPLHAVPTGWKLVPVEPTENMVVEGFESEPDSFFSNSDEWEAYKDMSGCAQAAHKARLCWAAMIAASPSVTSEP